jgi:hypothetical protein
VATADSYFQRTRPYLGGEISTKQGPATVSSQRIRLSRPDAVSGTLPQGSVTGDDGLNLFGATLTWR